MSGESGIQCILYLGNLATTAKVSFFLEQHKETSMVKERHLESLCGLRLRQPHYLERGERRSGGLVSGWNLVVPQEVYERSWGKVL